MLESLLPLSFQEECQDAAGKVYPSFSGRTGVVIGQFDSKGRICAAKWVVSRVSMFEKQLIISTFTPLRGQRFWCIKKGADLSRFASQARCKWRRDKGLLVGDSPKTKAPKSESIKAEMPLIRFSGRQEGRKGLTEIRPGLVQQAGSQGRKAIS